MPLLPGATAFSEWQVRIHGFIATCVESSEAVLLQMKGLAQATPQLDLALTHQLQREGRAGGGGATNWEAASQQLNSLGLANTAYGPSDFGRGRLDLPSVLAGAVQSRPVLIGVHNAQALRDDWTGKYYNGGVLGHALVAVGADKSGFIVADPNTPQAAARQFVHYSAADLRAAGADSLVIPNAPDLLMGPGATQHSGPSATTSASINPGPGGPVSQVVIGAGGTVADAGGNIVGQGMIQALQYFLSGAGGILANDLSRAGLVIAGAGLIFLAIIVFFFAPNDSGSSRAGRATQRGAQAIGSATQIAAVAG